MTSAGNFDDMHSWAPNFGTRYFWNQGGTVEPFVAGFMGANRTEAMRTPVPVDVGLNYRF